MSIDKVCSTVMNVAGAAVASVVIIGVAKGCYDWASKQLEANKRAKERESFRQTPEKTAEKANKETAVDYNTAVLLKRKDLLKAQCKAFGCILARRGIVLEGRGVSFEYETLMTVVRDLDLNLETVSYFTVFATAISNFTNGKHSLLSSADYEYITEIRTANTKALHS